MEITIEQANRVLEVVDAGLCSGLGTPEPGKMCVEAAVNFAFGWEHGDEPKCVGKAVRRFKIRLNDSRWSSDTARAAGMREIAVCQLGSDQIDQLEFTKYVALEVIRQILPIALRAIKLEAEALACEQATDLDGARRAACAARKAAYAAYAAAAAYAAYAAYAAAAAYAAYAAAAAAYAAYAAAADAADAEGSSIRDSILTLAAKICAEALRHCGCAGVQLWDRING